MSTETKSLGAAIDAIVAALEAIEGTARITAIRAACDHLNLALPAGVTDTAALGGIPGTQAATQAAALGATDIRSLKELKSPGSAVEMACVLAYYFQHHAPTAERKSEIAAADVDKYFVQAGYPLPKRSDQLLVNAKAAGYFDSAARGAYRLNAVGHNLVAHSLPRIAGSHEAAPRKRARGKATSSHRKPNGRKAKR